MGWDCTVISSLGPVPKNTSTKKVQPAAKAADRGGEESEANGEGHGQTPATTPIVPAVPPLGRRYARARSRLPVPPGGSIGNPINFHFGLAEPPVAIPVLQAPLQSVGEVSLKKEGKEPKGPKEPEEPNPPNDSKAPKEGDNPLGGRQAAEEETGAETEDKGGGSTALHGVGAIGGENHGGKEAAPEAEMPSRAADECPPALGLEMTSSGELGHGPLTGDDELDVLSEWSYSGLVFG